MSEWQWFQETVAILEDVGFWLGVAAAFGISALWMCALGLNRIADALHRCADDEYGKEDEDGDA